MTAMNFQRGSWDPTTLPAARVARETRPMNFLRTNHLPLNIVTKYFLTPLVKGQYTKATSDSGMTLFAHKLSNGHHVTKGSGTVGT